MGCIIKRSYHGCCSAAAAKTTEQDKDKVVNSRVYTSPIQPSSAFHLRNRLLSRIGTKVDDLYVSLLCNFKNFILYQIPEHVHKLQLIIGWAS